MPSPNKPQSEVQIDPYSLPNARHIGNTQEELTATTIDNRHEYRLLLEMNAQSTMPIDSTD